MSAAVIKEFASALDHHELVKVKLGSDDRDTRAAQIVALGTATGADLVQSIGRVATFYRRTRAAETRVTQVERRATHRHTPPRTRILRHARPTRDQVTVVDRMFEQSLV